MPHTNSPTVRRAFVVLLAGTLGCGSDLVLPDAPPAENVALTKLTGDAQTGTVGQPLDGPLVVQVMTESQQPAPGVEVAFELSDPAAGTVNPTTTTTNAEGLAEAHWTLGTLAGPYTATARLVGEGDQGQIAQFSAAATPDAPDSIAPTVPLDQAGRQGQPVATAPQVRVLDRFGNPVPGATVSWLILFGGGEVSPSSTTDAEGLASTAWTLGDRAGVHKLTASIQGIHGSPVTFTTRVLF